MNAVKNRCVSHEVSHAYIRTSHTNYTRILAENPPSSNFDTTRRLCQSNHKVNFA